MPVTPIYIPMATTEIRLIMGTVCSRAVAAIWIAGFPRFFRIVVRNTEGLTTKARLWGTVFYAVFLGFSFIAAAILVGLVQNPVTTISDDGIQRQGTLVSRPVTIARET